MDWATASVAMASSLASASVAVWAVRSTASNAERDREHDREMAQEARRQDRRATAYVELLTALNHQLAQVDRTLPMWGPAADPPPPLGDPELFRLNALAAAFASRDVQQLVRAWTNRQNEFNAQVWLLGEVLQDPGPTSIDTKGRYQVTAAEQRQKVDAIRADLQGQLQVIEKKVNEELEGS